MNNTQPATMPEGGRVLFIAPQPFFEPRGSSFRIQSTVKALAQLGYQIDLLVFDLGRRIEIEGVNILRSPRFPGVKKIPIGPSWSKFAFDLGLLFETYRLAAKNDYTLIHGVEEGGVIAALCSRRGRVPFIFDMHSCMSEQIKNRGGFRSRLLAKFVASLEFVCMRSAAAVMTVGSARAEQIHASRMKSTRAFVVEDTVPDIEKESAVDPAALRKEFQLEGAKVILYTGNLASYQGVSLLLEAFARLKERRDKTKQDPIKLLIVGDGDDEAERRAEYKRFVTQRRVDDAVIFAGRKSPGEMNGYMALADVLVSPRGSGDNVPLKVYSYMAAGKPIVATRIISHTQILDDDCAFLCDPRPEAFASGLAAALDDSPASREDREARAALARKYYAEKYSPINFREKLAVLYRSVTAPGNSAARNFQRGMSTKK